jgi:tetratricopeptide (TPR) repeat protein
VAAGAHLDGRIGDLEALTDEHRATWLPKLLGGLGTTDLPVRLLPGALVLGGDPTGAPFVRVPQTDPLVVTVESRTASQSGTVEVRLRAGEQRRVATGADVLEIRTLAGEVSRLTPMAAGRLQYERQDIGPACAVATRRIVTTADVVAAVETRPLFLPATAPPVPTSTERAEITGELAYLDVLEDVAAPPLTRPKVGDRWHFAAGRRGGGMVALDSGTEILIDTHGDFPIERSATVATDRPWGAVFGVMLGRTMQGFVRVAPLTEYQAPASSAVRIAPASEFTPADLGLPVHGVLGDAYVPRDVDAELDEALPRHGIVVVGGPPHSGRARVVREALRRAGALVAVPQTTDLDRVLREVRDTRMDLWVWIADVTRADLEGLDVPPDANLAIVLDGDATGLPAFSITLAPTLSESELERAWQVFGPELALDPADPWSIDELALRERAVDRARREEDPQRRAVALRGYGRFLLEHDRRSEALRVLEESLEHADDRDVLDTLVREYFNDEQWERVADLAARLAAVCERVGDQARLAWALVWVGHGLARTGRLSELPETVDRAETAARRVGDDEQLGEVLRALSLVWSVVGDARAIALVDEAIRLRRPLVGPVATLNDLATAEEVYDAVGRDTTELKREAVEVAREAGDPRRLDLALARYNEQLEADASLLTDGEIDEAMQELAEHDSLRRPSTPPPATELLGSWNDGAIRLFADRVEVGKRAIPLVALTSITIVNGTLLRLPRVTLELRGSERVEFEIRAGRTVNFLTNNRAAEDFRTAVTVRQRFT